jgi:HD-GYP domain-containing protein (c-di-GMP phosphodiesterase class II)
MRFRTRAFLLSFLPFALLLTGSFRAIQKVVQSTVRDQLRSSLRENHVSISRLRSRSDLQNSRFLKITGENASLKAGLQLLLSRPGNAAAKQTVEDQLRELCEQMGFDFLMVSNTAGTPLAGVLRNGRAAVESIDTPPAHSPRRGLMMLGDEIYQVASVPMDQGDDNIGEMSVGERFDFSEFSTPAVLMRNNIVLKSSIPGISPRDAGDVRLGGATYISLPLQGLSFGDGYGDGYVLRSLQNLDAASRPVQTDLQHIFESASIGGLCAALVFSFAAARSIVKPIHTLVSHLRTSESAGVLTEFHGQPATVLEIRELTSSFNRAVRAIQEARGNLQRAYIEFVGSLASALDARDEYTAGHSRRVSDLSCAIGTALGAEKLDVIRISALLHDIGKIGIADDILQKADALTSEEYTIVKTHPALGRRILEQVHGFAPYLDAVEFHHENWDGTGYPRGFRGEETSLAARIIHISDAYDAMTTGRPYRRGMSHERALAILRECKGTQFDPRLVEVFETLTETCFHKTGPAGAGA